jgi:hypothetical protein
MSINTDYLLFLIISLMHHHQTDNKMMKTMQQFHKIEHLYFSFVWFFFFNYLYSYKDFPYLIKIKGPEPLKFVGIFAKSNAEL